MVLLQFIVAESIDLAFVALQPCRVSPPRRLTTRGMDKHWRRWAEGTSFFPALLPS